MEALINKVDNTWTLFLDRDGVINTRLVDDYIKKWNEFEFLSGVLDSIKIFSSLFGRIFIVTNQQGIGRGIMTEDDLNIIHTNMILKINDFGGRIDKIYHCPHLKESNSKMRKPEIGMGLKAKQDFKEIDFNKAIMVGDSIPDMIFGRRLGMKTIYISDDFMAHKNQTELMDYVYPSLFDFAKNFK